MAETNVLDFSSSPWKELATAIAVAAIAAGGYVGKRRIERKGDADALERRTKALALHKGMKEAGLTFDDLEKIEATSTKDFKRKRLHEVENQIAQAVHDRRATSGPGPGQSQSEMNHIAAADLKIAEAELERALLEAEMHCEDDEERAALQASQEAWKAFSTVEAKYLAQRISQGTIYPTIYLPEIERITIARAAQLKAHVEYLGSL